MRPLSKFSGARRLAPGLRFYSRKLSVAGSRAKRVFDFIVALVAIVALIPLFVLVATLVKAWDRGPILARHRYVGLGRREFDGLKFRTTVIGFDEPPSDRAADTAETQPALGFDWDWPLTTVGVVLRRLGLDQLPQLINVLKGDMSLVGPRPVAAEELQRYGENAFFYLATRPGLTGPWRINGCKDLALAERAPLDRDYLLTWSFSSDLRILLASIPALIKAEGANAPR